MERLTKIYPSGSYGIVGDIDDVVHRLAAIEDILGDEYDLDRLSVIVNQCMTMREEVAQRFSLTAKIPLNRLEELVQADREGRCVVLPCKPSDVTVYQLRNKKHARGMGVSARHVGSASVWGNGHYALHHQGFDDWLDRDFGKTWFLTEEEAQAALRREQDG